MSDSSGSHNPNVERTKLTEMVKNKDLQSLRLHGGVEGVATALGTNPHKGISYNNQDIRRRSELFGTNTFPNPPKKRYLRYAIECFKDITIVILLACAVLSLGFGVKVRGVKEGWRDGVSILVPVFMLVTVDALIHLKRETQFLKLSELRNNFNVEVVRDGRLQRIPRFGLVVGDVVLLKIGDEIPADGLFLDGCSLKVDESSMTGKREHVEIVSREKPFLISGSKVVDGYSRMIVVSVGINTAWGKMMSSITSDSHEKTRLQARVENLASSIRNLGLAMALVVLLYVLVHYFKGKTKDKNGNKKYNGSKTDIDDVFKSVGTDVLAAVPIVVAAILPCLAPVKLAFYYAMKRMSDYQAIVRKLSACETLGSATVICTNKTGTLTLNQMEVTKFWIGQESVDEESHKEVASNVLELFYQAVGLNTTGSVFKPDSVSVPEFSVSPTEKAILSWAVQELGMDIETVKRRYSVLQFETFNSEKKRSGVSIRKKADKTIHVHWKGAAEIILSKCSLYYERNGIIKTLAEAERSKMENIVHGMAATGLRCIAFAHRQISEGEMEHNEDGSTDQRLKKDGLTFLGIVALKDPCRPGVRKAVQICNSAGVDIKMVTGDNVFTAKAIATECGILRLDHQVESGDVVEGKEFRGYTEEERMQKVDKIRVMAMASPLDKHLMVECLKKKGHVVAVTADGKSDTPALKEADIGISMGIQGTAVAQESFGVNVVDNGFTSVATVLRWGRYVYNNIQKFIQFQLTVNVSALVINVLVAAVSGDVALTAPQLLWVNLIIDALGALALATDSSTDYELTNRGPNRRTEPLITNIMWRNLLCQSLHQIAVLLFLKFLGGSIFKVSPDVINSMIFNTFVLCQVFNVFNARTLESKNIFEGIHKNGLLLGIVGISIALQFLMVEFGNKFSSIARLNWKEWVDCFVMAAFSWPVGLIGKFIPVPEKPLFTNSNGDLDLGVRKIIKYLFCCLLNNLVPTEDII